MFRMLLLCLGLTLITTFSPPQAVGQDSTTTTWKGTLNTPGAKLRLEIRITNTDPQSRLEQNAIAAISRIRVDNGNTTDPAQLVQWVKLDREMRISIAQLDDDTTPSGSQ